MAVEFQYAADFIQKEVFLVLLQFHQCCDLSSLDDLFQIIEKCTDVKWHFIGHLQRNKMNKVVSVPGLYLVETVDSDKIATALDTAWVKQKGQSTKLKVMAQINTSGEGGWYIDWLCKLKKTLCLMFHSVTFTLCVRIFRYGRMSSYFFNSNLSADRVRSF